MLYKLRQNSQVLDSFERGDESLESETIDLLSPSIALLIDDPFRDFAMNSFDIERRTPISIIGRIGERLVFEDDIMMCHSNDSSDVIISDSETNTKRGMRR